MLQGAITLALPVVVIEFTLDRSDILSKRFHVAFQHFAVVSLVGWHFATGFHVEFLAFCHWISLSSSGSLPLVFILHFWHFAIEFTGCVWHFAIDFHFQDFLHELVNSRLARPAQQKRVCDLAIAHLDRRLWLWVDCRVYRVPLCSCI